MGWTGIMIDKQDVKDHIRNIWHNPRTDQQRFEVVYQTQYGTTFYQAVKDHDKNKVFACVVLTSYKNGELIYKDIREEAGPFECHGVTQKFLDMLTPTEDEHALAWRENAQKYRERDMWLKKHLVPGSDVKMSRVLSWPGNETDAFTIQRYGKNQLVASLKNGSLGALPKGWKNLVVAVDGVSAPAVA